MDAAQSSVLGGVDAAVSSWLADECNRGSSQELSMKDEEMHADLARKVKVKELDAWKQSQVFEPVQERGVPNARVRTRWALSWKMMEGTKNIKARLVAKGYQNLDLGGGIVDTSGCVSRRPSHLQVISLCAFEKWKIRSLDIENALLRYFPSMERGTAYVLNGAPASYRRSLESIC